MGQEWLSAVLRQGFASNPRSLWFSNLLSRYIFFFWQKAPWIDLKLRCLQLFSLFSFSLPTIKRYWRAGPALDFRCGVEADVVCCPCPFPQLWLSPTLSSLISGTLCWTTQQCPPPPHPHLITTAECGCTVTQVRCHCLNKLLWATGFPDKVVKACWNSSLKHNA